MTQFKSKQELDAFLGITFTDKERELIEERWRIFYALSKGMSQREVARVVNCSVVTATRGAKTYRMHEKEINAYLDVLFHENKTSKG